MSTLRLDNIGTGWAFPVKVTYSGAASVISSSPGPYNFNLYPNGAELWVTMNSGGGRQTIYFNTGIWTTNQVIARFVNFTGGQVINDNNYLKIVSEDDNPVTSSITIDGPHHVAINDLRNAATALGLATGTMNGYGSGGIAWTRNPDPQLVTPNETIDELKQGLLVLLMTRQGEFPINRNYGVGLWDLLFTAISPFTLSSVKYELSRAVTEWDSRTTPVKVSITSIGTTSYIEITFSVREDQTEGQLVIPMVGDIPLAV